MCGTTVAGKDVEKPEEENPVTPKTMKNGGTKNPFTPDKNANACGRPVVRKCRKAL